MNKSVLQRVALQGLHPEVGNSGFERSMNHIGSKRKVLSLRDPWRGRVLSKMGQWSEWVRGRWVTEVFELTIPLPRNPSNLKTAELDWIWSNNILLNLDLEAFMTLTDQLDARRTHPGVHWFNMISLGITVAFPFLSADPKSSAYNEKCISRVSS